jgi:hypothetical protein
MLLRCSRASPSRLARGRRWRRDGSRLLRRQRRIKGHRRVGIPFAAGGSGAAPASGQRRRRRAAVLAATFVAFRTTRHGVMVDALASRAAARRPREACPWRSPSARASRRDRPERLVLHPGFWLLLAVWLCGASWSSGGLRGAGIWFVVRSSTRGGVRWRLCVSA